MTVQNTDRRAALKQVGLASFGAILAGTVAKAAGRIPTPAQTEGPFYPVQGQLDKDADLTHVEGHTKDALGTVVFLSGQVLDADTQAPIAGALVEFWQACASGKYNHPADPNAAPLDPNFQYWAQVHTDSEGRYNIKTICPGAYPADETWIRPPHIHVKVHKPGYPSLTTQLYFAGNEYNATDKILQALTPEQQALVIVPFATDRRDPDAAIKGQWNIAIQRFSRLNAEDAANPLATPTLD